MRGTNYLLALTTTTDEITGDVKPLFAFPVQVCKATEESKVKFDVAAPSGAKREQQWLDPATGEIVENDACPRGVFVGDEFRTIPKETIDAINAEEKVTTMVALGTVDLAGLREQYGDRITGRYFLQSPAKGGSAKAYRLTYEGLLEDATTPAKAIITKRTKTSKQALGFIYSDPNDGCLVLCEVLFAAQVREPDAQVKAPSTVAVEQKQIEMVRKVIGALPDGTGVLDTATDEAEARKAELIAQAVEGQAIALPTPVADTVVTDDLEAQLLASLSA